MRVLHVIPAVAPRYGGPSTAIWPMTAALKAAGMDVEIATTDVDGPGHLSRTDLPASDVPVHLFEGARRLAAWLDSHTRDYALVHSHSLWNRPTAAACRAARQAGVPYVVRPCGMLSEYTWRRSWLKKRAYWWAVERWNVLGAAAVHATSGVEAADARACGVVAPVVAIPLGIEPAGLDTPARPEWLRARCGPAAGTQPIVLFLSRLHPKKGVTDFLLPAFAQVRTEAFLAIAGGVDDSTPGYGVEIEQVIRSLGLTDRVSLLGPIPPADRWAAFDGAAVFCLPSQSENFGIVVVEAMARGCPVVAAAGVDAVEHAVAAGAGRKVPLILSELAGALDATLTGNIAAGQRGQAYVAARLGWPEIASQIVDLYDRLTPARRVGLPD
jgi:glycosyltransferase involved in cell wall biosynthesis